MNINVVNRDYAIRHGVSSDAIFAIADWHRVRVNESREKAERHRHRAIAERLESLATTVP